MSGSAASTIVAGVSYLLSFLVALGLELTLLVVAIVIVRKSRPDASTLLAASAGLGLLGTVLSAITGVVLPRAFALSDYVHASAVVNLGHTTIRAIAGALLILGIARLASPPPRDDPTRYV